MVTINGEALEIAGTALGDYLTANGYDPKRVAIERNGDIVPKARYQDTVLTEGDRIEIVRFVGGG